MATDPAAREALPCADSDEVTREDRLALFRLMLLHRLIEERVGVLYRGGRVSGSVYTGRGQEAVGAAAGYALGPDDVCAPLNRELACHLARGVTATEAFRNFLGKGDSPTRGRDGNMHFGAREHGVFPLVSMLGDLCPLVVGAALAFKRRREPRVALTFWGDGAMSTGDVHEGLNLAAVLKVPAVFVLQSNGYAYSTPTSSQMVNPCMADRVEGGWGIPASRVDGSDAIATLLAMRGAIEEARAGGGPRAVEAVTLRLDGHAAHDDGSYMDQEQRADYVARRDPVERLAARLREDGLTRSEVDGLRSSAADEVAGRARGGRGVAGARPRDDARRRLRDGADVSDATAIAERVRAFVRDVVIPAEPRDAGDGHGPDAGAARGAAGRRTRGRPARAARRHGLRRARARRARPGARVRGGGLQPARPARAQLLRARRGQHAPARGGCEPGAAGALPAAAGRRRGALGVRDDRAGARRGLGSGDAADDGAARRAATGSSTGAST